ncbi:type II secretion system protein GspE [Anoxybacter fermentans]|uniref:protein-secreting ATPase n=1 Tax=Anoxybacter fermentans TaxID=1323375 RepID=A0A3Q9HSV4_9FIRM|nr:type II secretion system ATPase GspE [Anoxybacter fermentans]AZR74496.1 type II secretion system protein GspE [Anoxybacter fermentans]
MSQPKLGQILIDFNLITEEQFEEALKIHKHSNKRIGEILIDLGYITESQLVQVLEFQLGVPHVDLSKYNLDQRLTRYIPENIARRHRVVPLKKEDNVLKVAMADPLDIFAIDDIKLNARCKIEAMIASVSDIEKAIEELYSMTGLGDDGFDITYDIPEDVEDLEIDELRRLVEDAPIVRLTNLLIRQAIQQRASDIHIEPMKDEIRVRYRIDGVLHEFRSLPKSNQAALVSRLKIMAGLDIAERRKPQDGRIELKQPEGEVDIRISTIPTIYGEKVVLRILNKESVLLDLDKLGFSLKNRRYFDEMLKKPHGIILVTGPTGSGKTTTLFAALNKLNSQEKNISTVEDPVEYRLEGINQIQINPRVGLTFASALRAILRQDPDIIMIGEIRDRETASIAIRAAMTGHLVLSTIHTNDAPSAITRLIDMGIEPYLVSSSMIGVVAQRLVRKICPSCKERFEPSEEMRFYLGELGQQVKYLYRGKGCPDCNKTGYQGQLAIHEVLVPDREIRRLTIQNRPAEDLRDAAVANGMTTLKMDGIEKALKGLTSLEEVMRVAI